MVSPYSSAVSTSRRSPREGDDEPDEFVTAADDNEETERESCRAEGSLSPGSSYESSDASTELESMTAKGIQHLCSELLELQRLSNREFQKHAYNVYRAFLRVFNEVGEFQSDILCLKQQISTQRRLMHELRDNLSMQIPSDDHSMETDNNWSETDIDYQCKFGVDKGETLDTLESLLLEHQLDKALILLLAEIKLLENCDMGEQLIFSSSHSLPSHASKILELKARLTDQFVLLANYPKVRLPQLKKALSALCRLGENKRALFLLLKYYHVHLESTVHDLSSLRLTYNNYIKEHTRTVFSTIYHAKQNYEIIFGRACTSSPEFIQWTRDETKLLVRYLHSHAKYLMKFNGGISVVVEAANIISSFCSMLEFQNIELHQYLIKLMQPCMEEALEMHKQDLKKIIVFLASSDIFVHGKSPFPREDLISAGYSRANPGLISYSRKFVSLLEKLSEDISPLIKFEMKNAILDVLADLYKEYIHILMEVITSRSNETYKENSEPVSLNILTEELALLLDSVILVDILSDLGRSIVKEKIFSGGEQIVDDGADLLKFDGWRILLQELLNSVTIFFCQHLKHSFLSHAHGILGAASGINCRTYKPSQVLTPSPLFQAIVDIHFLLEIARYGGYHADNLTSLSLHLLTSLEAQLNDKGPYSLRPIKYEWAIAAAKVAIDKLINMEADVPQDGVAYYEDNHIVRKCEDIRIEDRSISEGPESTDRQSETSSKGLQEHVFTNSTVQSEAESDLKLEDSGDVILTQTFGFLLANENQWDCSNNQLRSDESLCVWDAGSTFLVHSEKSVCQVTNFVMAEETSNPAKSDGPHSDDYFINEKVSDSLEETKKIPDDPLFVQPLASMSMATSEKETATYLLNNTVDAAAAVEEHSIKHHDSERVSSLDFCSQTYNTEEHVQLDTLSHRDQGSDLAEGSPRASSGDEHKSVGEDSYFSAVETSRKQSMGSSTSLSSDSSPREGFRLPSGPSDDTDSLFLTV